MRRLLGLLVASWFLVMAAAPARAEWHEATTRHFQVYSQGSPEATRKAAAHLEKYLFMLRFMTGAAERPAPVKVKVFMLDNVGEVGDALPFGGSGIAGFYTASPRGPIAVTTRTATGGEQGLGAQEVLFHELAHHFMLQNFPATYPAWYVEGFAEYYSTTRIKPDDTMEVGHSVQNRYLAFADNEWLPLRRLLTAKSYADVSNIQLLYSQGWLLVHYLQNNKARQPQLKAYLEAINAGRSYDQAMNAAFGDNARKLDSELYNYAYKRSISAIVLPFKPIDVGAIQLRRLSDSEQLLLTADLRLHAGIPVSSAAKFAQTVGNSARRFQGDPYALRIATEVDRAAGNLSAAGESVKRWLGIRPDDSLALMHKGELDVAALAAARSADPAAWEQARKPILAAIRRSPNNPQMLLAYYNSFVAQGVLPPAGAQNGLVRAFELVPQDDVLRTLVAADFERRNLIAEAIAVIRPLAYSVHSNENNAKKKKKESAERDKYRIVGDHRQESASEMLRRLEGKLAAGQAPAA